MASSVLKVPARQELLWDRDLASLRSAKRVLHAEPSHASFAWMVAAGVPTVPLVGATVSPDDLIVWPMSQLDEAVLLIDRLLGPGGCPWDQKQTHESLKRHLLEEVYEVFEAIDSKSDIHLREELGDLLLQPILHAQIAAKERRFTTESISADLIDKLVRRHPHVFGDVNAEDAETVLRNWDAIKKSEKGEDRSILGGVPRAMPSLLRAYEVSKRAARAGFEWQDMEGVFAKLREEEAELREALEGGNAEHIESEIGDLLFTVVNLARWASVEPEEALRRMVDRFSRRFQAMEQLSPKPLGELSPEEWDRLWNQSKVGTVTP